MAKILLIGDPHLKISKFTQSVALLDWIAELVKEHQPEIVVNLGDTFDSHAVVRSELLSEFKRHVLDCLTYANKYYYVLGNHDMYKPNDSKYHALQSFDILDFEVIDGITNISDEITVVPYLHDFTKFPTETNPICFAHQTFVGADYGYYRPDVGADADKCNAEIIISGHVHKRQQFGKVYYPGTPIAENLNDVDQVKGIDIFDTETYSFNFIESPFPRYRSLSYTIAGDFTLNDMHEDVKNSINDKDHWILRISGHKPEITEYMKSKKWLTLQKNHSVRIKPEWVSGDKVQRVKLSSMSITDSVDEYIDRVYSGSLDKKVLKLKAQAFINNAVKSSV
jgi:DNA repair exonuclease SbcCD nuclease subunit